MNVYSWLRVLQHVTGVFNAFCIFLALDADNWFGVVVACVCVALVASTKIYPGVSDDHKKGKR